MLVLITYDVNTQTAAGKKRLRKVAKECVNYGQRVQNSVFECHMDAVKCRQVKNILEKIIDKEVDSLRFYYLGDKYKNKVEHIGAKPGFDVTETLILQCEYQVHRDFQGDSHQAPFTVISQYGLPIVTVAQFVRASGFGKSEYTKASHA